MRDDESLVTVLVDWLGGEREGDFSEAAHDYVRLRGAVHVRANIVT